MKPSALATVLIRLAALFLAIQGLISSFTIGFIQPALLLYAVGIIALGLFIWLLSPALGRLVAMGLE